MQGSGEHVYRQLGGVSRSRRQTANGRDYILPTQFASFLQRTAANQLGESRAACHGRHASFGLEARLSDAAVADFQCKPEYVSTGGILNLRGCIRVADIACIARVLEMIEKLRRIHSNQL